MCGYDDRVIESSDDGKAQARNGAPSPRLVIEISAAKMQQNTLKLLAWNIKSGAGARTRAIADAIARHDPRVVVLTEYRPSSTPLLDYLQQAGFAHAALSKPKSRIGGVAIVSRLPMREEKDSRPLNAFESRLLSVDIPDARLRVCGIYGPLRGEAFDDCWHSALDALRGRTHEPLLVAGDFNTGAPLRDAPQRTFLGSSYFAQLGEMGYVDLWRRQHGAELREPSCYGRTNGYRIDHAFATTTLLPRVRHCAYSHSEREQKVSDHSPIVVELAA
jgi:exonuclease III